MSALVLIGGILSLVGMAVWIGLLVWAARADGRVQAEHDAAAGDEPGRDPGSDGKPR
jgi:hypothetical protein